MLTADSLRIPKSWAVIGGADTGTFMGGAICAIDQNYELYVLEEFPNYHYTGDGTIELVNMTVREWVKWYGMRFRRWSGQQSNAAWVDSNTAFITEIGWGLRFRRNPKKLELRTEITREYIRNNRIHLMPWLKIIPQEMAMATWPEEESGGTGAFKRIKKKDHCLDGLEHAASRRPHPDFSEESRQPVNPLKALAQATSFDPVQHVDPHLGAL